MRVRVLTRALAVVAAGSLMVVVPAVGAGAKAPATVVVPSASYPTIQYAIDHVGANTNIAVSPGTYYVNLDFHGRALEVRSLNGPSATILDGSGAAPVATFRTNETRKAAVRGFMIRNGMAPVSGSREGGGVHIEHSSPTIVDNVIVDNVACAAGAGVSVAYGSPLIDHNTIRDNANGPGCTGGQGGGISVRGIGSAVVSNNVIEDNSWLGNGGGIGLNGAGTPVVDSNTIRGNTAGAEGGGISIEGTTMADVRGNLVVDNEAQSGGGINSSSDSWRLGGNTIARNDSAHGSALRLEAGGLYVRLAANALIGKPGQTALLCTFPPTDENIPHMHYNDIYSVGAPAMQGCPTLPDGNLSVAPKFVDDASAKGDFRLQSSSPLIDAGGSAIQWTYMWATLADHSLDGGHRVVDADGDELSFADIGAYEVQSYVGVHAYSADEPDVMTVSGAPRLVMAKRGNKSVTLKFSAPVDPGPGIRGYQARLMPGSPKGSSKTIYSLKGKSVKFQKLVPTRTYTLILYAITTNGNGAPLVVVFGPKS